MVNTNSSHYGSQPWGPDSWEVYGKPSLSNNEELKFINDLLYRIETECFKIITIRIPLI